MKNAILSATGAQTLTIHRQIGKIKEYIYIIKNPSVRVHHLCRKSFRDVCHVNESVSTIIIIIIIKFYVTRSRIARKRFHATSSQIFEGVINCIGNLNTAGRGGGRG